MSFCWNGEKRAGEKTEVTGRREQAKRQRWREEESRGSDRGEEKRRADEETAVRKRREQVKRQRWQEEESSWRDWGDEKKRAGEETEAWREEENRGEADDSWGGDMCK